MSSFLKIFAINIFIFYFIIFLTYCLINIESISFENVDTNFIEYFTHNSKFIILYSIPYFGYFYFLISFIYSAILFGLSFLTLGIKINFLIHPLFEIMAFSFPCYVSVSALSRKIHAKDYFYGYAFSILVLFIAALLEDLLNI